MVLKFTAPADAADRLWDELEGHRIEILEGRISVTPPHDMAHARSLSYLMSAFGEAKDEEAGISVVQRVGLWLPTGDDDYAVPDFSAVDKGFTGHAVANNCYDPHIFRLVAEVTQANWAEVLHTKAEAYAAAGVPVYVVVDRKHDCVLVLTDPRGEEYRTRSKYRRGDEVPFPDSIGVSLKISADLLLGGK